MTDKLPLKLFRDLFERGLGELLMLQQIGGHVLPENFAMQTDDNPDAGRESGGHVLLGKLVMDKGSLILRDCGLMKGVSTAAVAICWDIGIVGAVCDLRGNEWDSLTFLGADHCRIPVDLSSTRQNLLKGITTPAGENIISYKGSVYRGFKLMLDANLLPLVLPMPLETDEKTVGLAVCDFRFAPISIDLLAKVNDLVRTSIEKQLVLSVDEFEIDETEFEQLFGGYVKQRQ